MNVQERAMHRAAAYLTANPLGRLHNVIRHDNVVQHRRAAAFDDDRDAWGAFYFASQVTKTARPMTAAIDGIFGNGLRNGRLAESGHLSDGVLPCLAMGIAHAATGIGHVLGTLAGGLADNPGAAARGAAAGALLGCAMAWVAAQSLAAFGMLLKAGVLLASSLVMGIRLAVGMDAPGDDKYERDARLFVANQAVGEADAAWRSLKRDCCKIMRRSCVGQTFSRARSAGA